MEQLEGLLPDIIANAPSPRPTVREGFMSLLVFLPATFGSRFQPHLPKITLEVYLSDTEEYVRVDAIFYGARSGPGPDLDRPQGPGPLALTGPRGPGPDRGQISMRPSAAKAQMSYDQL